MDWKDELLKKAKDKGMCAENYAALYACKSKDEAIKLYFKTIDWALENDYPSLEVLRRDFNEHGYNGLFVDKAFDGELLNKQLVYVFHNCKGHIKVRLNVEDAIIPMLYFANDCQIHIECDEPIKIPLYIFGKNLVTFNGYGNAVFRKYNVITISE